MPVAHYKYALLEGMKIVLAHNIFKFYILQASVVYQGQLFSDLFQGLSMCPDVDNHQFYFEVLIDSHSYHGSRSIQSILTEVFENLNSSWKDRKETYNIFLGKQDYEVEAL